MATYGEPPSQHPNVFISFRGHDLRKTFVSDLHRALQRVGVNCFIDAADMGKDLGLVNLFKMIDESRMALVILSSKYTESSWCLEGLLKIKERVEEGKLVALPIFYKLYPSEARELEGDFGLNLWNLVKRASKFERLLKWKEALDFIRQERALVFDNYSDEGAFLHKVVMHVKNFFSMEQTEDSYFSTSVEGETLGILCDAKSDVDPEEAESLHSDDDLNLRKDDNFLGEAHSDATSCTQKGTENKIADPVNEEKKQGNVDKNSIMVTCDEQSPQHQVFINFRGTKLHNNFVSKLLMALKMDGVNVFIENDEKMGLDIRSLFKRIDESRIALVIFSSRYTESTCCLHELVKIKERRDEGKLLVIPIFYKVTPSEVKHLKGDFGVKFWNSWRINRDSHIIKWKEALKSVTSMMGIFLNEHG